jgi:hypothetical protein
MDQVQGYSRRVNRRCSIDSAAPDWYVYRQSNLYQPAGTFPMNPRLTHLIQDYAALERGVQELTVSLCRDGCELCTACCCRADICEEALDSPFLRLLHQRDELESDAYGFLTQTGCALEIGRPPVCYEFFCEDLLAAQPDDLHRDLLRILGQLPNHAGHNARGDAHLVEIMHAEELDQLAFQRLEKQMQESFQALEILQGFFNEGTLSAHTLELVRRIPLEPTD